MSELRVRAATSEETARWDELVARNPAGGNFVQVRPYAEVKASVGWHPKYVVFERDASIESASLVLERRIPLLGRYWYLPQGPAVSTTDAAAEHVAALRAYVHAHERRVFAVTVEPPIVADGESETAIRSHFAALEAHWRPGIQGNTATAIVDIAGTDDELLAAFHKRCRNMIRRAERDSVVVREYPSNAETFAHMHRLMKLVGGGGQQLRLRSHDYAEQFWRGFTDAGLGRFYGIEVDGTPALLAFVIRVGERAYYKDGGSERPRTSPGMSNLLQWHMMREVRDAGAKSYDMIGTPPKDRLDDPEAPNYSLAMFKLSFAREVTEFVGAFDVVMKPRGYRVWQRIGLPVAQRLHRRRYRDLDLF